MVEVRLTKQWMPMSPLGGPGELVLDAGGGRAATAEEKQLLGFGPGHAEAPGTALPYRYQDCYSREPEPVLQRVAILDNGRLRATFLPDLGGRLWSLYDLTAERELLHQPDAIQVANLAIRNAWFAGGIEWNLGVTGHWGLTCEPVCVGTVGGDVVRMWAYERILGVTWRLDAWLPDGADRLVTRVEIHNDTQHSVPVYWWSNIAVPQGPRTRVITDARSAYHFGYAYELSEVDVPLRDGADVSFPAGHRGSADYFYRVSEPWMVAIDGGGYGLGQSSSPELVGRKLFTWGDGTGGRAWQRWLSGSGSYAEIQAGLAPTQLEYLRLPPGQRCSFAESYGPVTIDPEAPWADLVRAAGRAASDPDLLARAEHHLAGLAETPVDDAHLELRGPAEATGWGAVEVAAGHRRHDPAAPFPPQPLTGEQSAWLRLATDGVCSPILQRSAAVGPEWAAHLERAEAGWLRDLLLGHNRHAAGELLAARELWARSAAQRETPDAWRALALTETDPEVAAELLVRAHQLDPARPGIAVEAVSALLGCGRAQHALDVVTALPTEVRSLPRVAYLECHARIRVGDVAGAEELIMRPLVLPDLREGDLGLDELWSAFQALKGTDDPLPDHYDFRMTVEEKQEEVPWT